MAIDEKTRDAKYAFLPKDNAPTGADAVDRSIRGDGDGALSGDARVHGLHDGADHRAPVGDAGDGLLDGGGHHPFTVPSRQHRPLHGTASAVPCGGAGRRVFLNSASDGDIDGGGHHPFTVPSRPHGPRSGS